jgi:2-keto-4-pentenoate hydratase/2-oxohepta-3-ene-1,7-dioic acid hydratase in catechol pathway
MRVVGIRRPDGSVAAGALSADTADVTVLAPLDEFWAAPRQWLAPVAATRHGGRTLPVASVDLVPPVLPGARVICIGLNYLKHLAEGSYAGDGIPPYPTLFGRWTGSLTVGGAAIPVPANEDGLDNDVTSRRAQKLTSQWTLGKNGDCSGPLGPMVPAAEVGDLRAGLLLQTRVNGTVVQEGRTDQMVYPVGDTLSLISRTRTLRPGDLLATGTPAGVGYARTPPWLLRPGDVVEVEVERLGVLRNPVVGNDARHIARPQQS